MKHFRTDIKEKIHTTENINDVIAYINKTYHLGMFAIKRHYRSIEIIKNREESFSVFLGHNFYLPTIANNIYIKKFIGNFHLCYRGGYNKFFLLMIERSLSAQLSNSYKSAIIAATRLISPSIPRISKSANTGKPKR